MTSAHLSSLSTSLLTTNIYEIRTMNMTNSQWCSNIIYLRIEQEEDVCSLHCHHLPWRILTAQEGALVGGWSVDRDDNTYNLFKFFSPRLALGLSCFFLPPGLTIITRWSSILIQMIHCSCKMRTIPPVKYTQPNLRLSCMYLTRI